MLPGIGCLRRVARGFPMARLHMVSRGFRTVRLRVAFLGLRTVRPRTGFPGSRTARPHMVSLGCPTARRRAGSLVCPTVRPARVGGGCRRGRPRTVSRGCPTAPRPTASPGCVVAIPSSVNPGTAGGVERSGAGRVRRRTRSRSSAAAAGPVGIEVGATTGLPRRVHRRGRCLRARRPSWPRWAPRPCSREPFRHGARASASAYPAAAHPSDPYGSVTDWPDDTDTDEDVRPDPGEAPPADPPPAKGGKGRAFTGIAAAAVVTVLAVVVAGQVADGRDTPGGTQTATDQARDARDSATGGQPTPSTSASVAALTYEQAMGTKYPLSAKLDGSGKFDAIQGVDKAPGKGQKYTYRVDVEQGLGLDGALFAEAVQKTLNDDRSWAHHGARTFERVYSGKPDFVITLASPGTTADWCAKSGLDTTEDNVSCDSAATERVMINAYRWAQGSSTYGDQIHAYRQMLINHEVGHRLGYSHVTCDKNGELAPVMQQQTKFLNHDGIRCRANPWPYPGS